MRRMRERQVEEVRERKAREKAERESEERKIEEQVERMAEEAARRDDRARVEQFYARLQVCSGRGGFHGTLFTSLN